MLLHCLVWIYLFFLATCGFTKVILLLWRHLSACRWRKTSLRQNNLLWMKNYRQNESNCLIRHHENGPFSQVNILLTSAAQLFSFLWDIWRCTCSSCTCERGFTSLPGWQSHPQQSNSGNTVCPLPADSLEEDILTLNAIAVQPADL